MKAIGAGFGRTGTRSLKAALELLGHAPCYHMSTVIAEPYRVRQWLEIGEGRGPGWDELFAGFQAALDWPAAAYWRELAEHYPDAKVILTVRDPDRWYDSVSETIFARALAERRPLPLRRCVIRRLVTLRAPDFALYPRMAKATIFDRVFDGRIDDRAHAIKVYENHIADVKATIPSDRLLVFDVAKAGRPYASSWAPRYQTSPSPRATNAPPGTANAPAAFSA